MSSLTPLSMPPTRPRSGRFGRNSLWYKLRPKSSSTRRRSGGSMQILRRSTLGHSPLALLRWVAFVVPKFLIAEQSRRQASL